MAKTTKWALWGLFAGLVCMVVVGVQFKNRVPTLVGQNYILSGEFWDSSVEGEDFKIFLTENRNRILNYEIENEDVGSSKRVHYQITTRDGTLSLSSGVREVRQLYEDKWDLPGYWLVWGGVQTLVMMLLLWGEFQEAVKRLFLSLRWWRR